ncbi:MAG: antitoxin [Candidatus Micrarchaeota archaeon]
MVMAQINIDEYCNQVLNVIKAKYNLHDKSEALNKFIRLYGTEYVEEGASEEYVKKILEICDEHMKKYPKRRMSQREYDELFEG